VIDLGGRKLDSFFGMKKKAGNIDKVPFYVELGPGVLGLLHWGRVGAPPPKNVGQVFYEYVDCKNGTIF
jgi:hypothetical protein